MKFGRPKFGIVLLYAAIAAAVTLSIWSFLRADYYRAEISAVYGQAFEVQWRASQIREKIVSLNDKLANAIAVADTRSLTFNAPNELRLLKIHINALLTLDYAGRFLSTEDLRWLRETSNAIETQILPLLTSGEHYREAATPLNEMRESMFRVVGDAIAHSHTVVETTHLAAAAAQNEFVIVGLSAVILGCTLLLQRNLFALRQARQLRSFTSLMAHMTQSRFAGLRLFLQGLEAGETINEEMLKAAATTVDELNSANARILAVTHSTQHSDTIKLGDLFDAIAAKYEGIDHRANAEARDIEVPESQFHLILDELITNALNAVEGHKAPLIALEAQLSRRFFRTLLIVTVTDNGTGMPPELVKKALEPFFSTRAGHHLGLGLTCCSEILLAMQGKLAIVSSPGAGTTVQIAYPLHAQAH